MRPSAFPPGLLAAPAALLDERERPDFRDVFGRMAASSTRVACAVTRIRLSTLDLQRDELEGLESLQVLVAELNALHLDAEARVLLGQPERARPVRHLARLLEEGVLEIRAAPLGGWSPDFTVFSDSSGPRAVLTGFHWFQRPYPHRGPALASLHGPEGAAVAMRRHRELWGRAHDVGPAVWSLLARAEARTRAVAGGPQVGPGDPLADPPGGAPRRPRGHGARRLAGG